MTSVIKNVKIKIEIETCDIDMIISQLQTLLPRAKINYEIIQDISIRQEPDTSKNHIEKLQHMNDRISKIIENSIPYNMPVVQEIESSDEQKKIILHKYCISNIIEKSTPYSITQDRGIESLDEQKKIILHNDKNKTLNSLFKNSKTKKVISYNPAPFLELDLLDAQISLQSHLFHPPLYKPKFISINRIYSNQK